MRLSGLANIIGNSLAGGHHGAAAFTNLYSTSYDGVDDYIDCGDNDNLSFGDGSTDSPFSISAWIKIPLGSTGFYICSKQRYDSPPSRDEYALYISTVTGKISLFLFDLDAFNRRGRITDAMSIIDEWFHVAATYNGVGGSSAQNGMKIYVNGVRSDTTDSTLNTYTAMHNTTEPFRIGAYTVGQISPPGNADEVAIFNSELSSGDITAIYNSGTPQSLDSYSSLVSWWRFEEGSGTTAADSGTGGNNGTLINGVTFSTDVP